MNENEKRTAAHALNLCTVSISQIIDYNDINVLKQEYDNILNNLHLENMPKDEALLDVIKEILDEITHLLMDAGDQMMVEREYQHKMKNAIWSAVPALGGIFASGNPIAIGLSLATQIGIGFMNYRRNVAEIKLNHDKAKWEISRNRLMHLNGLKKQLFETAWRLADAYNFPDEYRLTDKQISEYNRALMESNDTSRYLKLLYMEKDFQAYPPFWYQLGSTANRVFQLEDNSTLSTEQSSSTSVDDFLATKMMYRAKAIECFEKYKDLNKYNLLRHDPVTSAWAMEYLELLNLSSENDPVKASELLEIAESSCGNALDVLEICAFDYLRIGDHDNAARLFLQLVNEHYNEDINTQVLSCLYIEQMRGTDYPKAKEAKIWYKQLKDITNPDYIIDIPDDSVELSDWDLKWRGQEEYYRRYAFEQIKMKARPFYQKKLTIVYRRPYLSDIAEFIVNVLEKYRSEIDPSSLPAPEMIEYWEYKKREETDELADSQTRHTIFINCYSGEAKKFCKDGKWDYDELGIRFKTIGTQTTLYTSERVKSAQKEEFAALEKYMVEKYSLETSFSSKEWIRMYTLGFYKYLESENAIVAIPKTDEDVDAISKDEEISLKNLKASFENSKEKAKGLMTEEQLKKCQTAIHTAAVACGACGAIPIPVADAFPITATQIAMVVSLGSVFNVSIPEATARTIFTAVAAPLVGRTVVSSVLKFMPVVGWSVSAGVAFYITEAIGWLIAVDFARQYQLSQQ